MSIKKNIEKTLTPGNKYTSEDFKSFGKNKSIHSALGRLVDEGKLERISRGEYVAKGKSTSNKVTEARHTTLRSNDTAATLARRQFASRIGLNFDTDRDTYHALGYHRQLQFKDYYEEFKRGNIAKRIINAPAKATWRNPPIVEDVGGDDSEFTKAWNKLSTDFSLFRQFERADIRARIGRYGVLLLGLGGSAASQPPKSGKLLYVSSYMEDKATIERYEDNVTSPRFGLPTQYKLNMQGDLGKNLSLADVKIHHSRIVHIAEDLIDDNVYGTPALEAVFNNLFDLLKVVGGSAEAVWRTFDRGMAILLDADAELSEEDEAAFADEVEKYIHHDQRFMKLQGAQVQSLGAQAADPRGHFAVIASIIAGTTGIPQRVLFGSERGQLASQADERNWNAQIKERQLDFAEPDILRPFINKMIEFGVLPAPEGEIKVTWPDLTALSESEQVANTQKRALAARNLADVTFLDENEKRVMLGFDAREEGDSVLTPPESGTPTSDDSNQ